MPEIFVYAVEGKTVEQKRRLVRAITDAMVKEFGAREQAVVVQIIESPKHNKAKGGVLFVDAPPP
jgi:4-oxalocrotonate tautomerase